MDGGSFGLKHLFGTVRFGSVRFGSVRFGSVRFGSVRFGSVRFGSVRFGLVSVSVRFATVRISSFKILRFGAARAPQVPNPMYSHINRMEKRDHTYPLGGWFDGVSVQHTIVHAIRARVEPVSSHESDIKMKILQPSSPYCVAWLTLLSPILFVLFSSCRVGEGTSGSSVYERCLSHPSGSIFHG